MPALAAQPGNEGFNDPVGFALSGANGRAEWSNGWVDVVATASVTNATITINPVVSTVFFRLHYPTQQFLPPCIKCIK